MRNLLVIPVAGIFLAGLVSTRAADWTLWRGPNHNGISTETGWLTEWPNDGPKVLWKAKVGIGFSSFSISQGRAYTMGNQNETDTVYCFDASTGAVLWRHSYACSLDPKYHEGGPGSTPTVDGGQVYTISKRGHLFSLDAATGKTNWTLNVMDDLGAKMPTWGFAGSPLVQGDLLVLNVGGAGTAVDKKTGKVVWTSDKSSSGYATPVPITINKEPCVLIFTFQSLVAVKTTDGKEVWRHPWKAQYDVNAADPILLGDRLFISAGYKKGCAVLDISGSQPKVVWQNETIHNYFNNCIVVDGFVYGIDSDDRQGTLKCVDLKDGAEKWAENLLSPGALMAADGKLIVMTGKGELMIVPASPDGFKPMARAQVLSGKCWTTPILANGRLYVRNAQGDVACLEVKK